jgi:signal transduction histidine kinase
MVSVMRLLSTLAARKRAADEVAERATRARKELLAASNELRTPLHDIIRYCVDLRGRNADPPTVAAIETSATRVARLLADVLDVSGLQVGTVTLFRESCDAATLVERAIKHHRTTALDRGIRLGFEARLAMAVSVDRERIEYVLTTLLGLAIAAARVGAHIAVTAEAITDGVRFAIVDAAVSSVPAIFEPAAAAPTDELAVHLCHRVIEAHGGRFAVGAGGRTFWFTLPTEPSVLR